LQVLSFTGNLANKKSELNRKPGADWYETPTWASPDAVQPCSTTVFTFHMPAKSESILLFFFSFREAKKLIPKQA
jgi:hypothetical protein